MLSGGAVWCRCSGAVAVCVALCGCLWSLVVSGVALVSSVALWSSGVLCGGLFSGGLVLSLLVVSLVWSSGVWYIISNTLNFYAHEKSATLHDTLPLAYHTINFILELLHH